MKHKKKYPEDAKTIAGLSLMGFTNQGAASFMSMMFMIYLTDYAGIGALGATLGTVLLLVGRIVDAVDDPLQAWIMDRGRPTKWGKYKPFVVLSIVLTTAAIMCLYALPTGIMNHPWLVVIWVSAFYLLYDIGSSFYADVPLKQTLTMDPKIRAKHISIPGALCMMVSVPFAFFIALVEAMNRSVGDMHKSFAIVTFIAMGILLVLSMLGICAVKEGKHKVDEEESAKFSLRDIIAIFKVNKPLLIQQAAFLFIGFISFLLYSTTTYYIKWAYCADITTGIVDSEKFSLLTVIMGMMQMLPFILGLFIAQKGIRVVKGDPVKLLKVVLYLLIVCGVGMFVFNLTGILSSNYVLFFALIGIMTVGLGMLLVPQNLLMMESMDYGLYKTGKEANALCNAVSKFLNKAQQGISSAIVGAILIAIGYAVDSETDTFIGNLSQIPRMLDCFILITGLLPAILATIALVILKYYPIDGVLREKITASLNQKDGREA